MRENFQRTLNHQLEEFSKPSEGPSNGPKLTAEWDSIMDTILSTTKSTLGVMHKQHQDWFDTNWREIHIILHEKNSASNAHLQHPKSTAHYQRWIRICSHIQQYLHEMRNSWWMTKHMKSRNMPAITPRLSIVTNMCDSERWHSLYFNLTNADFSRVLLLG